MNVLFLTLVATNDINNRGLYNDLLRKFAEHGHTIYVVAPTERRNRLKTHLIQTPNASILNVKTLNIQKTNIFEKGIGSLLLEYQYLNAIKQYFSNIKIDLVLYSTPPITFSKVVSYFKEKDNAFAYLLLKDIFPQNAVDLGFMKQGSLLHNFFRRKEKELYNISDKIGCMSMANVRYILKHNPDIDSSKVEVCPNSIEPIQVIRDGVQASDIKKKYSIPTDKTIFIYGGNLGKPQGIDFLIQVLDSNKTNLSKYFLIVGDGTEYAKLASWFKANQPMNAQLCQFLPKEDYDRLLRVCDVGMLFLDPRFTIPNFPSRILSYMENKMPIIAATDTNSDIGETILSGNFGFWCKSGEIALFNRMLAYFAEPSSVQKMGESAYQFLVKNYSSDTSYEIIVNAYNSQ